MKMRDGRRNIEQNDIEILLESVDCMRLLIEAIRDETECDQNKITETSILLEHTLALDDNDNDNDNSVKSISKRYRKRFIKVANNLYSGASFSTNR